MSIREHKFDDMDRLVGGQPLWYWCLSFSKRKEIDAERAEKAGAKYVRDASRDGLKPDGTPDEAFNTARPRKKVVMRIGSKIREKIEKRAKQR